MAGWGIGQESMDRFRRRLRLWALRLRYGLGGALDEAAIVVEDQIREELRKGPKDVSKGGARLENYAFGVNPTKHLRIRSGRLIGSVGRQVNKRQLVAIVGTRRVAYAAIHEYGGTSGRGVQIPARPYVGPAMKATERQVLEILGRAADPRKGLRMGGGS